MNRRPAIAQPSTGNILLSDFHRRERVPIPIVQWNIHFKVCVFTKGNYFIIGTPNSRGYQNVHMEVTVLNSSSTTGFWSDIACPKSFYYLAMIPAGGICITKRQPDQSDVFL